jgi:3-phosphoshikimate 1-carboxyvinyltransferase
MGLYHDVDVCIKNANLCNDVKEMLGVYDAIGKRYVIKGDMISVYKGGGDFKRVEITIKECGTCLRFILPYFAFSEYEQVRISLGERLAQRPILPLVESLNKAGADIQVCIGEFPSPYILINKYRFKGDSFTIDSSESSQFLSSLLMYPHAKRTEASSAVTGSYVRMTEDVIRLFKQGSEALTIDCDPDYSTACYYWFYSYLMNKPVEIKEMTNIYQPDYAFREIAEQINQFPTHIDMTDMPDQIITLAFQSLFSHYEVNITGCQTLALKESDRIHGILENVRLLGGEATYHKEILTIKPLNKEPLPCTLKTYNDHRFAMTFMVLRQKYPYLEIDNVECIKKSCVEFMALLN